MSGETQITVVGNLVADLELRFTPNGDPVANGTIASTARVFDRQRNEFVDGSTLFLRLNIWRDMAENAVESVSRGMRVMVQGRLKQKDFEKDGVKRSVMELDVDEIGPSLRRARAVVTKMNTNSQNSQQQGQTHSSGFQQGGYVQNQSQGQQGGGWGQSPEQGQGNWGNPPR